MCIRDGTYQWLRNLIGAKVTLIHLLYVNILNN